MPTTPHRGKTMKYCMYLILGLVILSILHAIAHKNSYPVGISLLLIMIGLMVIEDILNIVRVYISRKVKIDE